MIVLMRQRTAVGKCMLKVMAKREDCTERTSAWGRNRPSKHRKIRMQKQGQNCEDALVYLVGGLGTIKTSGELG